jgi:NAD(P)-dependent dehydrogenase (short-subunit alcohol dehydrogenase family)
MTRCSTPQPEEFTQMTDKKVWFITGAGRGMGVDLAKAALAAGNAVVATGRNPDAVTQALGEADDLLAVKLDVTDPADAQAAVTAAVELLRRVLRGDHPERLPGPG